MWQWRRFAILEGSETVGVGEDGPLSEEDRLDAPLAPPLEMVVRGSTGMVEAILRGVAYDMRLPIQVDESIGQTEFLRQFGILPEAQRAGYARLQALPGERTLVTLWIDEPEDQRDVAVFSAFATALVRQLARLDFLEAPGVEKAPIGFRRAERPNRP